MNRLKFMGAPVEEAVHMEAHTPAGADRIVREAGFNWVYLMYNWGFPPEIEKRDWEAFQQAVEIYHAAGAKVFGYVQVSNCVYQGSFTTKDWYALDPHGKRYFYYTGRYMTCWQHPEWRDQLRQVVTGIVASGAEGVFFDNPWHAGGPQHLGGAWLGPAGCYCPRCQSAFLQASGSAIPTAIQAQDETSRRYLAWRASQVTALLADLSGLARQLNPRVVISANNFDAVMRPSFAVYGIDLSSLAAVQDVIMIEDFALPRWQPPQADEAGSLVNNALTARIARTLIGDTPLSLNPYDAGIGFDNVYPPRRFQQAVAESAALGAAPVIKGTEFVDHQHFTLLTAPRFRPQRLALGRYNRWLAEHADLFENRTNAARIGLLVCAGDFNHDWHQTAPLLFQAGNTLLAAGLPWRAVSSPAELPGLEVLLTPGQPPRSWALPEDLPQLALDSLPGWSLTPGLLNRLPGLIPAAATAIGGLYQAYFRHRWARQLGDGLGLTRAFLQSPYFNLPDAAQQRALLDRLASYQDVQVSAEAPVLIELWQQGSRLQVHLVNYSQQAQPVSVRLPAHQQAQLIAPDRPSTVLAGQPLTLDLDIYAVLLL
jgi:hypothetical protein